MRYIEPKLLKRVNALAKKGDQKAKDFLFGFRDMKDEEASGYLASLEPNEQSAEPEEKGIPQIVEALIKDENEAIDAYDEAIKFVTNSDLPNLIKEAYIGKLQKIKDDEIKHIDELKEIL